MKPTKLTDIGFVSLSIDAGVAGSIEVAADVLTVCAYASEVGDRSVVADRPYAREGELE
jgi:hypothetical protein